MDHAIIDPDQAYEEALRLTKYDDGNTKSNTLYWVATRGMSFLFLKNLMESNICISISLLSILILVNNYCFYKKHH